MKTSLVQSPGPEEVHFYSTTRTYRPVSARLDRLYFNRPRPFVVMIVAAYLLVATLFAVVTPPWQNPDEPAHYNNIAQIVQDGALPVLRSGDYNQVLLDHALSEGFPATLPLHALRYEAYQPPLYYLLAAPIFAISGGNLLVLRLFSVLLGAATIIILYRCLETVFANKVLLTVGATAFAAFLPMHVAMNASVNNDSLAELLLVSALLLLLRWLSAVFRANDTLPTRNALLLPGSRRTLILLGVLLGLGLITKIYAYLMLPLSVGVVLLAVWLRPNSNTEDDSGITPSRPSLGWGIVAALWVLVPAILIALPLWLRNIQLYGAGDFLGLGWHDLVVTGQPTTAEWIDRNGWVAYAERAVTFTFRSFWGVFGWLGVFMDERVYTALLVFTGITFFGILWSLVRFICGSPETDMDPLQFWVLRFFAVIVLGVVASYLWYNLKFVQHQGRYLFWGLLPLSTGVALGWREVMQPFQGKITGFMVALLGVALGVMTATIGTQDRIAMITITTMGILLFLQPFLLSGVIDATIVGQPFWLQRWLAHRRLRPVLSVMRVLAWGTPFILLFVLDLLIPFWYIGPQLAGW